MSLRRTQSTSVKDTAAIDFKEGFFQNVKTTVEVGAVESLKNEIAELRAKLEEVPVKTMFKHHEPRSKSKRHEEQPMAQAVMSKLDNLETSLKTNSVADSVMAKLDHLERKLKPEAGVMSKLDNLETSLKTNSVADSVMAKLDQLERKLKPETGVMSKLDNLETTLKTNTVADAVMAKLDHLESKFKEEPLLSKLDAIERKLQSDGKFHTAMSHIDSLKTQMQSEQSVKEAVFTKLAKLEEQVKVKNSMPVVTMEDYNKEQARLRKLEAMRSKLM